MQQVDDWKLPSQGQLEDFRKDRGLSMGMLNQVEVREIVVGSTDEKEIKDTLGWFWEKYYEDQSTFPTNTVSIKIVNKVSQRSLRTNERSIRYGEDLYVSDVTAIYLSL